MFKKIALAFLFTLGAGILLTLLFAPDVTIKFSQEEANAKVMETLPFEKQAAGATIKVEEVNIDFKDENLIQVTTTARVTGFGVAADVTGAPTTGLRYENGNFYLADATIDSFDFKVDAAGQAKIKGATSIAQSMFNKFKENHMDDDPEAAAALEGLKDETIAKVKTAAISTTNSLIQSIPIYSLNNKDIKHSLAKAALKDVQFTDTHVVAILSPKNLILTLLGWVFIGLAALGMAFGMIRGGGTGLGAAAASGLAG